MYDMISTFRMSNLPNISTIWIINNIYIARKDVDIFCAISTLLWKMLSLLCLLQSYFLCCKQALLSNHLLICQQSVQTGFTHTSLAIGSCRSKPSPHLRRTEINSTTTWKLKSATCVGMSLTKRRAWLWSVWWRTKTSLMSPFHVTTNKCR